MRKENRYHKVQQFLVVKEVAGKKLQEIKVTFTERTTVNIVLECNQETETTLMLGTEGTHHAEGTRQMTEEPRSQIGEGAAT